MGEPKTNLSRLVHLEAEVAGIRSDFSELKLTIGRLFDRFEALSVKGSPSWQAIFAFVFSSITALSVIGGGIAVVVAMFVRSETNTISATIQHQEQQVNTLTHIVDVLNDDHIRTDTRLDYIDAALKSFDRNSVIELTPNHTIP